MNVILNLANIVILNPEWHDHPFVRMFLPLLISSWPKITLGNSSMYKGDKEHAMLYEYRVLFEFKYLSKSLYSYYAVTQ